LQRACRGQGGHELGRDRPAFLEHDPVGETVGTISNERTFREDVSDPSCLESMLCSLCERVCWRARRRGMLAATITLKLRYADFQTLQRSRTVPPTSSELELYPVVRELFARARQRRTAVRLLGLRLSNLRPSDVQLSLLPTHEPLHRAMDGIRERYGYESLRIALAEARSFKASGE